jgi:hypothetical protein
MTTRLNKHWREAIRNRALHHRFDITVEAFYNDRKRLAYEVLHDIIDSDDRAVMNGLEKGWLPPCAALDVQFGEHYTSLRFGGNYHRYSRPAMMEFFAQPEDIWEPLPYKFAHGVVKQYSARDKRSTEFNRIVNHLSDIQVEYNDAAIALDTALAGHTNVDELVKAWPEIAPFVQAEKDLTEARTPRTLPVVQRDVLNKMLDLPIEGDDDDV